MKLINKYTIGTIVVLSLLFITSAMADKPTPEELLAKANAIRLEAMKGHCEKVGSRVAACYTNKTECDKMHDSIAWFSSEYGEAPEIACVVEDFLALGE